MREQDEKPIRGWLVVLVIVLVQSAVVALLRLLQGPVFVLWAGSWSELTAPGSGSYHPLWMHYLVVETLLAIGCLVAVPVVLTLLSFRSPRFPAFAIAFFLFTAAASVVGHDLLTRITLDEKLLSSSLNSLNRAIIWNLIWVPYLLVSRRVRETFPSLRKSAAA